MKNRVSAPAAVRAQFKDWCRPKLGRSNPENQTNDVWSWLVESRLSAYTAHEVAGTGKQQSPGWCFERFGQTETLLPDGTKIYIGGEHEDYYDPDFFIYNDVVRLRPDQTVEIFGYPADVFPPTDNHSATLIGDAIYIIGGLRYPEHRNDQETQVYRLGLNNLSIQQVETGGLAPAWLHNHEVEIDCGRKRIFCTGGYVTHPTTQTRVENLTNWVFDLETCTWSVGETKAFTRWLVMREDESLNDLHKIEKVARASRSSLQGLYVDQYRAEFESRGHSVDPELFYTRFQPPVPHSLVEREPEDDAYNTHRIMIDGVVVRYVEDWYEIAVTVEGTLPPATIAALQRHGCETYSRLEGVSYKCLDL